MAPGRYFAISTDQWPQVDTFNWWNGQNAANHLSTLPKTCACWDDIVFQSSLIPVCIHDTMVNLGCTEESIDWNVTLCGETELSEIPRESSSRECFNQLAERLKHVVKREPIYLPNHEYINSVQRDGMKIAWRWKMAKWLQKVCVNFGLEKSTYATALNYMDKYFSRVSCPQSQVQLVGLTSIFTASKVVERKSLRLAEMVPLASFSAGDIVRMESELIAEMGWRLNPTTPYSIMHHLTAMLFCEQERPELELDACTFIDYCLEDYSYLKYTPSDIASASLLCALTCFDISHQFGFTSHPRIMGRMPRFIATMLDRPSSRECAQRLVTAFNLSAVCFDCEALQPPPAHPLETAPGVLPGPKASPPLSPSSPRFESESPVCVSDAPFPPLVGGAGEDGSKESRVDEQLQQHHQQQQPTLEDLELMRMGMEPEPRRKRARIEEQQQQQQQQQYYGQSPPPPLLVFTDTAPPLWGAAGEQRDATNHHTQQQQQQQQQQQRATGPLRPVPVVAAAAAAAVPASVSTQSMGGKKRKRILG